MEGWISLHRKLLESPIFHNPDILKVWVWCLLKASHEPHTILVGLQEQHLKEGQFVFGRKKASQELNMSESKVYRIIKRLEMREDLEVKPNNKYSVITIVNWAFYQDKKPKLNSNLTTNEQQMNTNNNGNNGNNKRVVENDKGNHTEVKDFFEKMWALYPTKIGKAKVTDKSKKEIYKLGEEFERCISRYLKSVEVRRKNGFATLSYQNGSTFFNGGYIDYLDENAEEEKKVQPIERKIEYRDSI